MFTLSPTRNQAISADQPIQETHVVCNIVAGVVTLAVACVFAAGWLRSLRTSDFVRFFPVHSGGIVLLSEHGSLDLQWWSGRRQEAQPTDIQFFGIHFNEQQSQQLQAGSYLAVLAPIESNYFLRCSSWRVFYSYLAPPLTLLAAYLLLSKPRSATSGSRQNQHGDGRHVY